MQEAVAVLLLRPVPKQGDFDADTTPRPPIELTELVAGVRKGKGDFGELVVKDGSVELVKPSLQLFRCDFHTFVGLVTLYYMQKLCQNRMAVTGKGIESFIYPLRLKELCVGPYTRIFTISGRPSEEYPHHLLDTLNPSRVSH